MVKTLFSTGLCRPDKGNVEEILTALHFPFCCDECRQHIAGNEKYTTFAVPLDEWINSLQATSSSCGLAVKRTREVAAIRVNFIHVCRDYTRSPWSGLSDQVFLQNLYDAGTAFFTYPGCDLIDFVAPSLIYTGDTQPTYSSVVASIKSGLYSPGDAEDLCAQLKKKADDCSLEGALCIVCIFGQASEFDDKAYTYDETMLKDLEEGKNVAIVLRLPRSDRFDLVDIVRDMTTATEWSQLRSSHSFLRARGQKLLAKDALRTYDTSNPPKTVIDFQELMKDLDEEY
jgi:hypothetical protein